jgi:Rieske 2Fe-2S family protein
MDAATFRRDEFPLHKVAADVWDGHIFLNLSQGEPLPLDEQLGDLVKKFAPWQMGELHRRHRIVYDLKANWKLIVANYNECLHCPLVHPALNRLTDYLGADNEAPKSNYIGGYMGFRPGMETMTFDGQRRREYLPGLNSHERQQVQYYAIYPNFLLSLSPDYMLTHILWPRAVDRTEIICEFHFRDGEAEVNDAVEFWDCINREDWKIVEASQAGISSRSYRPGPYSPREVLLAGFDQEVLRRHGSGISRGANDREFVE